MRLQPEHPITNKDEINIGDEVRVYYGPESCTGKIGKVIYKDYYCVWVRVVGVPSGVGYSDIKTKDAWPCYPKELEFVIGQQLQFSFMNE